MAMVELTGYQIINQIYDGIRTLVYRGTRTSDQKPVVIKLLRSQHPSFNELMQFCNQYTIAKNLNFPGVIKTYSLENYRNGYALVMEDFGGISLKQYYTSVERQNLAFLQEFFPIAIQVVSALEGLYRSRVIHKDIKPANILINPTTKQVKLIDFSIASLLLSETQVLPSPNILEGTLTYLSPEQTGQINRGIDYRSDFYSLGVTSFELLTGYSPFRSKDAIELVHSHLAKLPPDIRTLNPEIPSVLCEIVSKLMAKNAEDRYQSALGLKHDLETCWQQWKETGKIDFNLGQRDRFIPEKLYNRASTEVKIDNLEKRYPELLASISLREKVPVSTSEIVFTSGEVSLAIHDTNQTVTSSTSISEALNLAAVMKASQALSSEIQLDKLLSILMQVVLENAGSEKCALILLKGEKLAIEAIAKVGEVAIVLQSIPVEESQEIPVTLINYVSRTQETLIIDRAIAEAFFINDPYINRVKPKSILCTPIINQGKLLGILYLENNQCRGAFTSARAEILRLICSQVAISLENARLYQQSQAYSQKLEQSLQELQQAQLQMIQNEKMSTLGNLVAGVAHEINNPVGFVTGNLKHAEEYIQDLVNHLQLYQQHYPNPVPAIQENAEEIDIEFLTEDLPSMITSMQVGIDRIRNISTSLRTFSRADTWNKVACNIHEGIDSTLLILKYRLKANDRRPAIEVITEYSDLPIVKCFPGQLNQVFMNIIANAIDALDEASLKRAFTEIQANPNRIAIRTEVLDIQNAIIIRIKDNGAGISQEVKSQIFDNLFTTKAVGKGTGLGLTIARQIVEETHAGKLSCISAPGEGTEFAIQIPM